LQLNSEPNIVPSIQSPLGALHQRFRRQRLLIIGCGDVGQRVARQLLCPTTTVSSTSATVDSTRSSPSTHRMRVLALTSSPERMASLRASGITPLLGNLDRPASLARLAGLATRVLHLAPPPTDAETTWWLDPRTQHLVQALRRRSLPRALVYGSTSGVYGDCQGDWVTEARAVHPHTPRAQRRVDAEKSIRFLGRAGVRTSILRIPGIYAKDREGGTPRTRLLKGTPVMQPQDDVYTNHIHADDLARACIAALWRGKAQRVVNISDHSQLKMGDYFDQAADMYGLPRPPRVARSTAQDQLPLMLLSFMSESRRLDNTRMLRELRLRLHYPTTLDGLRSGQR
jgi:nucleoside-diphosphate-sugar epimerase